MSGAMRRIGEYLGLLEDTGYDEFDGDGYDAQETAPAREARPDRAPRARSASVADINERRRSTPAPAVGVVAELSRITTLHPSTYNEARAVGEQYRDGTPVIMNLSEMNDADAKRLVDFAAGLIFATRGSIERVTAKVFLLSPPNVTVAAADKQRIAEGGFFNQS
ncbi:cell division protein SepF [Nocardioides bizhenqiangii]|uniref:Cell division protein SepF n=1 Tax=Nocardioides bizhenqiangii TaxID=3095076 RepID=A0ABZ0ZMM1_9ACTN|nr:MULTISPECIES: cell division protein SepF [unclassified Nocardioides]MDZ5620639.1 cell division protein SepF [Nocardioides sp. HM23]WQQ25006.1 cell division protein SepF [Nocardioides sp. HM61]